ncbi:MAG: DNA polymerase Y family protein, partial [Alphaproteobacteria bacterium]|nr:DNA polymerase Y family protein [Alphaproteobacteria bacterium]
GDLAGLPRAALANRFGGETLARLDRALGRAPEPISPRRPAAPHLVRRAFAEAIARTEDVEAAIRQLVAALCRGLEAARQGARRLELAAYRVDGTVQRLAVGTGRPSRDRAHLARLFAEKRDRLDAGFGFDALVLAAPVVEPFEGAQHALDTGQRAGEADDLAELTDRLANRLGPRALLRPVPRQSHVPERAVAGRPPLAAAPADADLWPAEAPRPIRLFRRPQEVEAVAPVPDDPPLLFRWQGETFRVRRADGPERIAPEWWPGQGGEPGETRDYYRVEDETGRRFWLFRAGLYDADHPPRWFLHGLFG